MIDGDSARASYPAIVQAFCGKTNSASEVKFHDRRVKETGNN
jgi:hypothetical protein